jgi:hypothetical protein
MAQREFPPRFAVHYEETFRSQPAMPPVGNERDGVHAPDVVHERAATTLAGARSIQRALHRRGQRVHGIYERINIRPAVDEQNGEEYSVLVCGKLAWEWDSERPVDEQQPSC